jgi:hypothetical protein
VKQLLIALILATTTTWVRAASDKTGCTAVRQFSLQIAGPPPGCGAFAFGTSTQWVVRVQEYVTKGTAPVIGQQDVPLNGSGWCGGAYLGYCVGPTDNPRATPYWDVNKYYVSDGGNGGTWYWQAIVTSTPPGGAGAPLPFGFGCAPSTQTITPNPARAFDAPTYCGNTNPNSPIVIDTAGEGFHLTDLAHGVSFRQVRGDPAIRLSWTDPKFRNGWLTLPRDGKVEALSDLFGNFTPQPASENPNGYLALATYDLDRDGVIDSSDGVYARLRVWIDRNHDGVCQPAELFSLVNLGIKSISVKYRESPRVDQFGNQFRYESTIEDLNTPRNRRTYDVFLLTGKVPGT